MNNYIARKILKPGVKVRIKKEAGIIYEEITSKEVLTITEVLVSEDNKVFISLIKGNINDLDELNYSFKLEEIEEVING